MKKCTSCGNDTPNPKFCSRSCAASYINVVSPRKVRTKVCKKCPAFIRQERTYCENCTGIREMKTRTLEQSISSWGGRSRYNNVRHNAHVIMKNEPRVCSVCGYDKHVQLCHIKAIHSYPLDTLLSVINSRENLVFLCPNHHWELDHGLL